MVLLVQLRSNLAWLLSSVLQQFVLVVDNGFEQRLARALIGFDLVFLHIPANVVERSFVIGICCQPFKHFWLLFLVGLVAQVH